MCMSHKPHTVKLEQYSIENKHSSKGCGWLHADHSSACSTPGLPLSRTGCGCAGCSISQSINPYTFSALWLGVSKEIMDLSPPSLSILSQPCPRWPDPEGAQILSDILLCAGCVIIAQPQDIIIVCRLSYHCTAPRHHYCVQAVLSLHSPKWLGCALMDGYRHALNYGMECPAWSAMDRFAVSFRCQNLPLSDQCCRSIVLNPSCIHEGSIPCMHLSAKPADQMFQEAETQRMPQIVQIWLSWCRLDSMGAAQLRHGANAMAWTCCVSSACLYNHICQQAWAEAGLVTGSIQSLQRWRGGSG